MHHSRVRLFVFSAVIMLISSSQLQAEEANLGKMLRESGWRRLLGSWVDEDTKGKVATTTYAWKYENHVIEATSTMGELAASALIGRNADSGEVFHMGADNQGGSSLGKWTFDADEAVLEFVFTAGDGQQGGLKIRHSLKDEDTMNVTIEAGEPISVTMIRTKK